MSAAAARQEAQGGYSTVQYSTVQYSTVQYISTYYQYFTNRLVTLVPGARVGVGVSTGNVMLDVSFVT